MSQTNPEPEQSAQPVIRLRPNVAGIVQNAEGRILICERLNTAGSWQFPQGGVDKGESPEGALVREMEEELSLRSKDYTILSKRGPYRYVFGNGRLKKGYHGQEQDYFLLRLTGPEERINVVTKHQEFSSCRWIEPWQFKLDWVPDFKREVYRAVLSDFFGIER
jgi:putative (di)nucleoside polyphosphate hydrolase